MTAIQTPFDISLSVAEGELAYWKEILPLTQINYEGVKIDFSHDYMNDLILAHNEKAQDQTPFMLADADNRHTMDPERWRGDVQTMVKYEDLPSGVRTKVDAAGGGKGLYGRIVFPDKDTARSVMLNPKLGVSAKIREGVSRVDGKNFNRKIVHVLGTLDPKVTGMSPWLSTDLANTDDTVLVDLSRAQYPGKGNEMAYDLESGEMPSNEQIDSMSEAELDAFLAKYADAADESLFETDSGDSGDDDGKDAGSAPTADKTPAPAPVAATAPAPAAPSRTLEPALSNEQNGRDVELANVTAALNIAQRDARDALNRAARAEWDKTRTGLELDGVPPVLLDLAEPVMARPHAMVIDLSNSEEKDIDVSEIVGAMLEASKGIVDLSNPAGHGGNESSNDEDERILAAWPKF